MSSSDSEDDEAPEMVTREVAEAEEESRQKRENRDGTNKKKKREAEAKREQGVLWHSSNAQDLGIDIELLQFSSHYVTRSSFKRSPGFPQ